jgi:hypothetical protein
MGGLGGLPFVGKTVTLSFYARAGANFSASGSQISAYIPTGTGTDQPVTAGYTGETNPVGGAVTLTTTWQRFTFTGTIPTTATEMGVKIFALTAGTAGAADYFEVTGVQVELGSTATSFARNGATYQGELAACQRYYYRTTADSAYSNFGNGTANSTTSAFCLIPFPVNMRVAPTAIDYSTLASYDGTNIVAVTSVSNTYANRNGGAIQLGVASGLTQYRPQIVLSNNSTSAYIGFTAEL